MIDQTIPNLLHVRTQNLAPDHNLAMAGHPCFFTQVRGLLSVASDQHHQFDRRKSKRGFYMHRTLVVAAAICATLAGCAEIAPAKIAAPASLSPIQSNVERSKTIYIANVAVKLIDKKIGQMKGGTLCVGGTDLMWVDNHGVVSAIQEQMEKTLSQYGYKVDTGLIPDNEEKNADVVIGVAIENIHANICYSVDGMKGSASLTLKWEVMDNKTKQTFFVTGSGASSILKFSRTGDPDVFVNSAEMATKNILAQDTFFQATRK
ncbi:hypothetical protein [Rhodanobacter sp. C06]|uniref:hypothetical protein n=1 Tax=Rhodanobacter sp. C06 TaxID=1945854 RepID=UPI0011156FDA|nr:hypothetical protein [Rhodanobacter sp. C06]